MSFSFLKYQAVNRKYFIIQSTSALHWALDLQILISNLYKPWDLTKSSPNLIWATFTLYIQRNSFSALWTGHMSQYDLSPTKSHHLFTRWWASVESVFLKDIPWQLGNIQCHSLPTLRPSRAKSFPKALRSIYSSLLLGVFLRQSNSHSKANSWRQTN